MKDLFSESDQESCVGTPVKTPGIGHLLGQGQPPVWPQRRKGIDDAIQNV